MRLKNANIDITLAKQPFAGGGEGELYKIIAPASYQNAVAKIYHPEKRTQRQAHKIEYLIKNPPNINSNSKHQSVVWMADSVFDSNNGDFMGFIMPFAQGEKLEILCSNRIPKKYAATWRKFDFEHQEGIANRKKICFNIALAVYEIHRTQKYVLVDLKPENIIIQENGLVSIIDIDSVQVVEGSDLLHPARVATPEFSPPEYYKDAKPGETIIFETWDRFSLAVIFYKLLFGLHPYAGSSLPPFDRFVNLQDKIKHGLFVYSASKQGTFSVVPPPHQAFLELPTHLQNLFIRCFEFGHEQPNERPTANEWCWGTTPRPPLVEMRRLPSMQLPAKVVQYTPAISLNINTDQVELPVFSPSPPSHVNYKDLPRQFLLPQITLLASVVLAVAWMFFREVPWSSMTALQLGSVGVFNLLLNLVNYYSFSAVRQKHLTQQFKKKIAKERHQKRTAVLDGILALRQPAVTEKSTQREFFKMQDEILSGEKRQIDRLATTYRRQLSEWDQQILQMSQNELDEVKQLDVELSQQISQYLFPNNDFLSLPEKLLWVKQQLQRPEGDVPRKTLERLKLLLPELEEVVQRFENGKAMVQAKYDERHRDISQAAQARQLALAKDIEYINQQTNKQQQQSFQTLFKDAAITITNNREMLKNLETSVRELEDLYQNYNEVSNTLLGYERITLRNYFQKLLKVWG